jgi:hypothetical protein
MPIGESGRIVIEVDPHLKRELYSVLERERLTLKKWFVERANRYVASSAQMSFSFPEDRKSEGVQS